MAGGFAGPSLNQGIIARGHRGFTPWQNQPPLASTSSGGECAPAFGGHAMAAGIVRCGGARRQGDKWAKLVIVPTLITPSWRVA
jgi:hypothetical protein